MLYRLTGSSLGRAGCAVRTSTGHQLKTDLPTLHGGDNSAAQPIETLLSSLLGCEVATAHYVARYLWPKPHNRIKCIVWEDVKAKRDERGALALPIDAPPPVSPILTHVSGTAIVSLDAGSPVSNSDVHKLGELVEQRCPVAAMFVAAGCEMKIEWRLEQGDK
jgi:uncharacterized OsmC-like protein